MLADIFVLIPTPLAMILMVAGAWAAFWDARKSYVVNNFRDARVSRAFGVGYIVLGVLLWFARRLFG